MNFSNCETKYAITFLLLLLLLGITFLLAHIDLGLMNISVGLAIAAIKAFLVGMIFMDLKHSDGIHRVFAMAGIFWLLVLFSLSMGDFFTRDWLELPGSFPN